MSVVHPQPTPTTTLCAVDGFCRDGLVRRLAGLSARQRHPAGRARPSIARISLSSSDDGYHGSRARQAFASAKAALGTPTHCQVWMKMHDGFPHVYVTPSAVVRRLSDDREKIRESFAAAVERLPKVQPLHRHRVDAETASCTPRRCLSHAPPGRLVTMSPNRPHGPPRCAAMNLVGAAVA